MRVYRQNRVMFPTGRSLSLIYGYLTDTPYPTENMPLLGILPKMGKVI